MKSMPVKTVSINVDDMIDLKESLKLLTEQESRVMALLLREYTIGEISLELGISYRRVLELKAHAIEKMGRYYGVC